MRFARCLVMSVIVSCVPLVLAQDDTVELPAILTEPVPPRPELPEDVAAEVEEMEARIEEVRVAFLKGENNSLVEAIELAERVAEIRATHQTGWTDVDGSPSEWWEVGDARRRLSDLQDTVTVSAPDKASLASTLAMGDEAREAYQVGQLALALETIERQFEIRRRVLGDDNRLTLGSASTLGFLLEAVGRFSDAETLITSALQTSETELGRDHPVTVRLLDQLCSLSMSSDRHLDAKAFGVAAVRSARRVFGPDHSETLFMLDNMSVVLSELGEYADAEFCQRAVLARRRDTLTNDHPVTMGAVQNLAWLLKEQGKLREAEPLLRESFEGYRRILGSDHPDTFFGARNLGLVLLELGEFDEAEFYLADAFERRTRVLGSDHPSTLESRLDLADLLRAKGAIAEAETHLVDCRTALAEMFGESHPRTIEATNALGWIHLARMQYEPALSTFQSTVKTCRESLDPDHPQLVESLRNLASTLLAMDRDDEAYPIVDEIMSLRSQASLRSGDTQQQGPMIEILAPLRRKTNQRRVDVDVFVFDFEGIIDVTLMQDGSDLLGLGQQVSVTMSDDRRRARVSSVVEFRPGTTSLAVEIVASNQSGRESRHTLGVEYEPPARSLYILALGVADYDDDSLDLRYPTKDVDDIVQRFRMEANELFSEVLVKTLMDSEVNSGNVKQLREEFLRQAQPDDTILVFAAGHAVRGGSGEYYFLASHCTPDSPYDGIDRQLLESLVTWNKLYARRRLLLLDTCYAGAAFDGTGIRSGVTRPSPFEQSEIDAAKATGLYILAASAEIGFAQEIDGNGIFTRAVLEGLDGVADEDSDGIVDVDELAIFVRSRVHEQSGGRQRPTVPLVEGGEGFPLTRVKSP